VKWKCGQQKDKAAKQSTAAVVPSSAPKRRQCLACVHQMGELCENTLKLARISDQIDVIILEVYCKQFKFRIEFELLTV
jgi:hypothetical protein